jgi:ADP-ribosyl-[dinitrogen reductase] hydrolase
MVDVGGTTVGAVTRLDRVLGCFLGGATGDALGAAVEFLALDDIRDRFGPAGVVDPPPGAAITDDTQMALFTAEGLAASGESLRSGYLALIAPHLHQAYRRWLRTQSRSGPDGPPAASPPLPSGALADRSELYAVRSPGNTCLTALGSGRRGSLATAINDSKGSGGVMRVAPVGLVDDVDPFTLGAEAASITHGHPSGYLSAGAFAVVIADAYRGRRIADAANHALDVLARYPRNDETSSAIIGALDLARREPAPSPEIVEELGSGWVGEEALAIALYASLTATSFEAGVRVAVNHSGDSDTTGALAGNLLGVALGVRAVPSLWMDGLAEHELVRSVAPDFAVQVLGLDPSAP